MAHVKLLWTRLAIADLTHAHDFIASENTAAAIHLIERIEKSLEILSHHPELGRPGRVKGIRELIVPGTPFVIPYRTHSQRIEILAVLHGARKWPETL